MFDSQWNVQKNIRNLSVLFHNRLCQDTIVSSPVSRHAALAEWLPLWHWLWNVHGDIITKFCGHNISSGIRVSFCFFVFSKIIKCTVVDQLCIYYAVHATCENHTFIFAATCIHEKALTSVLYIHIYVLYYQVFQSLHGKIVNVVEMLILSMFLLLEIAKCPWNNIFWERRYTVSSLLSTHNIHKFICQISAFSLGKKCSIFRHWTL